MEDTYSGSDVSLSPSQILERLEVLKQLQLLQRGKLQKQRLQYTDTSETSSNITEIVSHFSTSYNTFRSLLQSSNDTTNEGTPRCTPRYSTSELSSKVHEQDLIDGVSVLNLSQESEFVVTSPVSSRVSASSRNQVCTEDQYVQYPTDNNNTRQTSDNSSLNRSRLNLPAKKQISLDDMPILSPKKDFESLLLEKLQNETSAPKTQNVKITQNALNTNKKPFLRRGEGIARFGLKKSAIVIQNTKSLPWRRKSFQNKSTDSPIKLSMKELKSKQKESQNAEPQPPPLLTELKPMALVKKSQCKEQHQEVKCSELKHDNKVNIQEPADNNCINQPPRKVNQKVLPKKNKHPLFSTKGQTWASVFSKEQSDFLQQLKQTEYYKNFNSPTKSIVSDASCDETLAREREAAEQNMFELLENKVCHDSFNINNSFFNRFLRGSNLECSGESTPLVMQKCLSDNPELRHIIIPPLRGWMRNENSQSDVETTCSNCTDCCSDSCSSVSCCSCKTVQETPQSQKHSDNKKSLDSRNKKVKINQEAIDKKHDDTLTENDSMKANMAEMNAKLIATSELLKERLKELEDEIETFRKENASLSKLREEIDLDRQKFYEEKSAFEQKFNEEKVLAEYYLAEEKEKLSKQKQIYERQVKEMRGRLNKKEKDEVVILKKEINDLKEEIRLKDAKSTSTIARLRNQIKIMEKEKKDFQEEIEKLKKQNRRIQHSNEVSRRLSNIKYLEEINKKLTNMAKTDSQPEVRHDKDVKYKAFEIERQSRSRKLEPLANGTMRLRAKSVPNLKITSRYAKYFSQRDAVSQMDKDKITVERFSASDDEVEIDKDNDTISNTSLNYDSDGNESENNLEKLYMERFRATSPKTNRYSGSTYNIDEYTNEKVQINENKKGFFLQKSNSGSIRNSKSPRETTSPCFNSNEPLNRSKSPVATLSNRSSFNKSPAEFVSNYSSSQSLERSKSPLSTFNHSSLKSTTVIHNEQHKISKDKLSISPEPSRTSKSTVSKTSLNPTEIKKPDGSRELRFPNGNLKYISADGKYSKFIYYNGDVKENFYNEGRIKYFFAETKTYHTTHADGLEILEFPDGQVEKRYKDGSSEIRLPNGSVRYFDPKNEHVREEWRFPDGAALTVSASGEQRITFTNGQVEVHAKDHKRREFPDGTVKLIYNDGTSETRYASGRVRIKDKHGNLIMDSAPS